MADKKRRPLHFALSSALLVPGLAAGCGPEEEGPMINVPADDPPEVQETANPVGEPEVERVPHEPPPSTNLTDDDGPPVQVVDPDSVPPPEPTPNPSGD